MKRKAMALVLAMTMALGLAACGGSADSGSTGGTGSSGSAGDSDGAVSFTIFNSKNEIQEDLEELADAYAEENNCEIEVYYSQDTVAAHLATKYAAKDPYTLVMVDAKDVYSLGKQYGYDMSGAEWIENTDYAIDVDDKVLGFPVCIEARGILYNKDAIEETLGEDFDPAKIETLDDFKELLDRLVDAGMESPTAILKPDWSLAAHYLQQVYEERQDPEAFIQQLYAGEADLINDEKFNALMDTFDTLMEYNMFKSGPISVEDEMVHKAMSEGEDAFQFGGCWEWNDIIDFDYTGNVGIMPVPQSITDDYTGSLVGGGSKFFYIDNSEGTSAEQQEAAADFLEWLVASDEGQNFISDTCGMVSPFKNNTVACSNDIGAIVKEYADAGKMVPNYDYDPDDHYSVLGAVMQKYLAGQLDRKGLAEEIEDYWANVTPVEH